MNRRLPVLALGLLLLWTMPPARLAGAGARLVVPGEEPKAIERVYHVDGTDYFSAAAILEALGMTTAWQARPGKLVARRGEDFIVLAPDLRFAVSGTSSYRLDKPPRFINGEIFVTREFVERALPVLCGRTATLDSVSAETPPKIKTSIFPVSHLKRIVVDAGHGGHDTGARSPQGILEKNINLGVAKALRDLLEREAGIDVIMTRDADYFIPLFGRTQIGNRAEADLFVSIHANGAARQTATGLETYFLSLEATDRQTARLAAEENMAARFDTDSPFAGLSGEDDLKAILIDLVSAENMKASERLAAAVQRRIVEALRLPNRGVKQAPFFVLVGSKIPAILVEVGFVSNPEEAARLTRPEVQKELAGALFQAILYYDSTLGPN